MEKFVIPNIKFDMKNESIRKVESLNLDDMVWYIYIFIAVAALYSNKLEKEYTISGDKKKLTEFHSINLVVLTIAFFVYIYFIFIAYRRYSNEKSHNTFINVIASTLFLIGGGMFLYLELKTTDSDINNVGI